MSVIGTYLYLCTSRHCCERLHLTSMNFFARLFQPFAHFMMGDLWVYLPTPHWVISSFWPKTAWPSCPHPPYSPYLTPSDFFCLSRWKKSLQREMFSPCRRSETKKHRNTKRHQNWWVEELSSGKNASISVLHQMKNTLKVTEV